NSPLNEGFLKKIRSMKNKYARFFTVLRRHPHLTKEQAVLSFTNGATDSLKALDSVALHELTLRLDSMAAATPPPPKANTWQYPGGEKANNMRRGIIAIFKNTGRSTAQAIAWAEKQGVHGQKKAFNDYTTGELYVLLGLAEKIRTQQEQKTRKTFLDQ
ncbi:MAG TPA: hypothetical protein PK327_10505, partial [Niabella sp.]|nr:hypothetical protein [Niabella sp.]